MEISLLVIFAKIWPKTMYYSNREVALRNILHLCPSLGRVLINTYRDGAQLYIDGESIASAEGTTQGDPLAMAMYALGVKPLIETMSTVNEARQVWFADDCTTSGSVLQLSHWWEALLTYGPQYGYHPNATKTTLLVKPDYLEEASHLFKDTDINIVTDGACVLGVPIGSTSFVHSWIADKVKSWVDELTTLSEIALSQPQSVFSALTHGVMSHWSLWDLEYLTRRDGKVGKTETSCHHWEEAERLMMGVGSYG